MFTRSLLVAVVSCTLALAFAGCSDSDDCEPCPTCPPADEMPADVVADLAAGLADTSSVVLTWTAPEDAALGYDVRYNTGVLDDETWETATRADGEPAPGGPGATELFRVTGLDHHTEYNFAVRTRRSSHQWSDLSNVATDYTALLDTRGLIAFSSDDEGEWSFDICLIRPDGTGLRRIPVAEGWPRSPSWSPDGERLVFALGLHRIAMLDLADLVVTMLVPDDRFCIFPVFAPDGQRVLFVSEDYDLDSSLVTVDLDGSNQTVLHTVEAKIYRTSWSPDGATIVYACDEADPLGTCDIYALDVDSGVVTRLTTDGGSDPCWSPDGERIAYTTPAGNEELLTMAADGSDPQVVAHLGAAPRLPGWSPDGTRLTYQATHQGNESVFVVNVDGTGAAVITDWASKDRYPSWSPMH